MRCALSRSLPLPCSLSLALLLLPGCADAPSDFPDGGAASGGASTGGTLSTGGTGGGAANSGGVSGNGTGGTSGASAGGAGSAGTGGQATTGGGGQDAGGSGGQTADVLNCGDPANLPRTFTAIRECIIEPGCQSSICHGGEVPLLLIDTWENFPRREDHSPYDLLTETLLNYRVDHCNNSPLVDPGNPENSAIVKALSRGCDDPEWGMPDGCFETPCVPQEYIDFIADWIAVGAPMQETP